MGSSRWQSLQKEKKQKRNVSFIRWWLVFFGVLLVLGLGFKIYEIFKKSLWDGRNRINFLLKQEGALFVSFEPREENLVLILMPKGIQLEVPHGYGQYRLEAISELENLEKRQGLFAEAIQENLAIPVDGWIKMENGLAPRLGPRGKWKMPARQASPGEAGGENGKDELLDELLRQMRGEGKTNFSLWDLGRLWWQIKKVKGAEVKVLDLAKLNVLTPRELPDGTEVFEIEQNSFDLQVKKFLADSLLRKENLSIEVLNGTNFRGLAERGARLLTNIGGEVVAVGNSEGQNVKCKVESAKDKKDSYTVQKIRKIWFCDWEEKKEEGRAEVTLILGEDYWQKLNQK